MAADPIVRDVLTGPLEGPLSAVDRFAGGLALRHGAFGAEGIGSNDAFTDALMARWALPGDLAGGLEVFGADDFASAARSFGARSGYFSADFERGGPFVIPVDPAEAPMGVSAHQVFGGRSRMTALRAVPTRRRAAHQTPRPQERYRRTQDGTLSPYPAAMGSAGAIDSSLLRFPEARAQLRSTDGAGAPNSPVYSAVVVDALDGAGHWSGQTALTPALAAAERLADHTEARASGAKMVSGETTAASVWLAPKNSPAHVLERAARRLDGPADQPFARIADVPMALVSSPEARAQRPGVMPDDRDSGSPRTQDTARPSLFAPQTESAAVPQRTGQTGTSSRPVGAVVESFGERLVRRTLSSARLMTTGQKRAEPAPEAGREAPQSADPFEPADRRHWAVDAVHRILVAQPAIGRPAAAAPREGGARQALRRSPRGRSAKTPWRTAQTQFVDPRIAKEPVAAARVTPLGETLISPSDVATGQSMGSPLGRPFTPALAATFSVGERTARSLFIESASGELVRSAAPAQAAAPTERFADTAAAAPRIGLFAASETRPVPQGAAASEGVVASEQGPQGQTIAPSLPLVRTPLLSSATQTVIADPGALSVERFADAHLAAVAPELLTDSVLATQSLRSAFGYGDPGTGQLVEPVADLVADPVALAPGSPQPEVGRRTRSALAQATEQLAQRIEARSSTSPERRRTAQPAGLDAPQRPLGSGAPQAARQIVGGARMGVSAPAPIGTRRRTLGRSMALTAAHEAVQKRTAPMASRTTASRPNDGRRVAEYGTPDTGTLPFPSVGLPAVTRPAAQIGAEGLMVTRLLDRLATAVASGAPMTVGSAAELRMLSTAAGLEGVDLAPPEAATPQYWQLSGEGATPGVLMRPSADSAHRRGPGHTALRSAALGQQIRRRTSQLSLFTQTPRVRAEGTGAPWRPGQKAPTIGSAARAGRRQMSSASTPSRALLRGLASGAAGPQRDFDFADFDTLMSRPELIQAEGTQPEPAFGRGGLTPDNTRRALVAFDAAVAKQGGGASARPTLTAAASGGGGTLISPAAIAAASSSAGRAWPKADSPFSRQSAALPGRLFGDRGPQSIKAPTAGRVMVDTAARAAQQALASTPGERPGRKAETNSEARHRLAEGQIDDELSPEVVEEVAREVIESLRQLMEFEAARNGEDEWD